MLYTVIADFEGTTSISQYQGRKPTEALQKWANSLDESDRYGFTTPQMNELRGAMKHRVWKPALIEGARNVWYESVLAGNRLLELTIVQTSGR